MRRSKRFCRHAGCGELTDNVNGYCDKHQSDFIEMEKRRDIRRGSAKSRGYDSRWSRYSKWFLSLPQNQLCALRLDDKCAIVAQCVDHIKPPESRFDPLFWDINNHQPACIHCNSVKGDRTIKGKYI